jgi:hypothetical protein
MCKQNAIAIQENASNFDKYQLNFRHFDECLKSGFSVSPSLEYMTQHPIYEIDGSLQKIGIRDLEIRALAPLMD